MDSNAANATAGLQTILANYQETQQRAAMYDGMIATLKDDQNNLAERALKGDKGSSMLASAAGAVISTAALAGALAIAEAGIAKAEDLLGVSETKPVGPASAPCTSNEAPTSSRSFGTGFSRIGGGLH